MNSWPDEYKGLARGYDLLTRRPLASLRRGMALLCRRRKFRLVLDLGCGTGAQLAKLRELGISAVGLDASPAMLRTAQHALHLETPSSAPPLVRGTLPLPFADDSFDAAILSLVVHESPAGSLPLLLEALRVARRLVILDWRMPERNLDLPGQLIAHAIERLAGKDHYRRFRRFAAGGWLRGALADAGALILHEQPCAMGLMTLVLAGRP